MDHRRLDQAETATMMNRRISAPLTSRIFADSALPVPPILDRLWRHWRACTRGGNAPWATAMELRHLRHLNCVGRFVAHVALNPQGFPQIKVASSLPSPEAGATTVGTESEPLHPAEAAELAEDWPIIAGGRPVLRIVACPDSSFDHTPVRPLAHHLARPLARLCLPIRTDSDTDIDSMVMAVEPADPALADLCDQLRSNRSIHKAGHKAGNNTGKTTIAGLGRPSEPSSLPLETRLAFRERIHEATVELKRQAADRPDAERRGMLLEAARLQRLARRY